MVGKLQVATIFFFFLNMTTKINKKMLKLYTAIENHKKYPETKNQQLKTTDNHKNDCNIRKQENDMNLENDNNA